MVVWLVTMYVRVPRTPFVGNYVAREGVLSTDVLAGNRPDVIPSALFNLLVVVGSISGIVIVLAAVPFLIDLPRRVRERDFDARGPAVARARVRHRRLRGRVLDSRSPPASRSTTATRSRCSR